MKYIKCMLMFILIGAVAYGALYGLKVSYDTFPTFRSTLDTVVSYM